MNLNKAIIEEIAASIQDDRRSAYARKCVDRLAAPADEIVGAFLAEQVSGEPVLYVHDSGDVILWAGEDDAEDDDGSRAIGRWQVPADLAEALAELDNS